MWTRAVKRLRRIKCYYCRFAPAGWSFAFYTDSDHNPTFMLAKVNKEWLLQAPRNGKFRRWGKSNARRP